MVRTGSDNSSASQESQEGEQATGIEALNQRLEQIRGNLNSPSDETQEQVFNASRQDLQVEETPNLVIEEQRDTESHTASAQTSQVQQDSPTTMSHSATVTQVASDMFGDSPNAAATSIGEGVCEYPRSQRSTEFKVLDKQRKAATEPLELKYLLPSYYSTGGMSMQQERSAGKVVASAMQMAFVGVDYRNKEMKIHINKFDMVNSMMVPEFVDKNGEKPANRWDFTKARRHVLDRYGSIPLEEMKLWAKDMKIWTKDKSHDQQDNKWLYTLA